MRIWLCLLLFYRMCNRIQGRTPVFLKWTFGISYDPSDVVSEVVHLCSHGVRLGVIEDPSDFLVSEMDSLCWFCLSLLVGIHQTLVSEVDPLSVLVDVELNRCRRQNLLLLIRFQHEGICEA